MLLQCVICFYDAYRTGIARGAGDLFLNVLRVLLHSFIIHDSKSRILQNGWCDGLVFQNFAQTQSCYLLGVHRLVGNEWNDHQLTMASDTLFMPP